MSDRKSVTPIDPLAFVLALICSPLLSTFTLCWTLIPIIALYVGGMPYLIIGTPILLLMIRRWPPTAGRYALAGILGNGLWLCWEHLQYGMVFKSWDRLQMIGGFSMFFAALWAGLFAVLYRWFYRNPLTGRRADWT